MYALKFDSDMDTVLSAEAPSVAFPDHHPCNW